MAKRRGRPATVPGVPGGERARKEQQVKQLGVEVAADLRQALKVCAAAELRSHKAIVTLALQQYLSQRGLWPPAEGADRE